MDSDSVRTQEDPLDQEIAALKRQATTLRRRLQIECSTILSAPSVQNAIQSAAVSSSTSEQLAKRASQQRAYVQQSVYRISTSVTAFKIHDPDPNAVDGGHVLGVRFEIMSMGQFLRPYYVMLNRPYANSKFLRVHRHTIPPAVPLSGLAARHLPAPQSEVNTSSDGSTQDLERFVRTLRREIMRYHNRLGVTADLRRSARISSNSARNAARAGVEVSGDSVVDVGIADIQAKQIKLTWADERSGRIVLDDDGNIQKFVVFGPEGRDWRVTRQLLGSNTRVEDLAATLQKFADG